MNTPLLDWVPPKPLPIDGATYDADQDEMRLNKQALRVYNIMKTGEWFTPMKLEMATGYNWASISARIRDFRKQQFHVRGHVDRRRIGKGLFEYRLSLAKSQSQA